MILFVLQMIGCIDQLLIASEDFDCTPLSVPAEAAAHASGGRLVEQIFLASEDFCLESNPPNIAAEAPEPSNRSTNSTNMSTDDVCVIASNVSEVERLKSQWSQEKCRLERRNRRQATRIVELERERDIALEHSNSDLLVPNDLGFDHRPSKALAAALICQRGSGGAGTAAAASTLFNGHAISRQTVSRWERRLGTALIAKSASFHIQNETDFREFKSSTTWCVAAAEITGDATKAHSCGEEKLQPMRLRSWYVLDGEEWAQQTVWPDVQVARSGTVD